MDPDVFARRLEAEGLLLIEDDAFALAPQEQALMRADLGDGRAKNISLAVAESGAKLRGARASGAEAAALEAMLRRYAIWARALVVRLAPAYAADLEFGRTSFRPRPVDDAPVSARKDDRRLHVDAFASQPTGGRRILRVFANVDPQGAPRRWRVGEPFEVHARHWLGRIRPQRPGEAWLLERLGVTRNRRTAYDAAMLTLHDSAKLDAAYQQSAPQREIDFPAGAAWIVFTDSTVHAAIAGRCALEQTFYLPLSAMVAPEAAPARILERLTGRKLVPA